MVRCAFSLWFVIAVTLIVPVELSASSKPLPVESILSMKEIKNNAPISVSPDGLWVAYTLQPVLAATPQPGHIAFFSDSGTTGRADRGEVWVANTHTHEQIQVSAPKSTSWDPSWSPNGQLLAFYSDADGLARLWVWDLQTRRVRRVSSTQIRTAVMWESPVWSPDGRFLLTKTLGAGQNPSTDPTVPQQKPILTFDSPSSPNRSTSKDSAYHQGFIGDYETYRANLTAFDLQKDTERVLASNQAIIGFWWSPKERQVLFAAVDSLVHDAYDYPLQHLELIDLVTSDHVTLADNLLLDVFGGLRASWSPDGSKIAYLSEQDATEDAVSNCYVVDLRSHLPPALLSKQTHISATLWTAPVWTSDSSSIEVADSAGLHVYELPGAERLVTTQGTILGLPVSYRRPIVRPDSAHRIFAWERNKTTFDLEVHRLNLLNGNDERVSQSQVTLGEYPTFGIDASDDGNQVVYVTQSAQAPPDLWMATSQLQEAIRLTTVNPEMDEYKFGKTQLLSWRSDDGKLLHGAILLPPDFVAGHACPLVVDLYGGALLASGLNVFGANPVGEPNNQLLATRGYAVLLPDSPMGVGTPMLDIFKDVMPGVSRAVDLGFAQEDFIGIMGTSYGGYSTLSLISQTQRFKAAIAIAPVADVLGQFTFMEDDGAIDFMEWALHSQGGMGASPWEHRERYIDNSPVYFADRITTPVLLAVGAGDIYQRPQTREMFASLKALNKSAEYVEYPNGGHTFDDWPAEGKRDFANRMINWFDKRLKAR